MNNKKPYLVVVPARGGSKGIPLKNIYPLDGKPLLSFTLEALAKADINADVVVSTDSEKVMRVARDFGKVHVVKRPDEISGDLSSTEDALIDALFQMRDLIGCDYDAVVTAQPTSPFRKPSTLQAFLAAFESLDPRFDSMLTLSETYADYWICSDGGYERLYPQAPRRRQDRSPLYVENSCLYVTKTSALLETRSVLGRCAQGFVIHGNEALDINEPIDLAIAETMLSQKG